MIIAVYLAVILCLLLLPGHTAAAARDALRIWGLDVAPSLFPYMVFSRLLARRLQAQSLAAAPLAALLGLMGGSPSGASVLAVCADRISARTLPALCALTGTVSPMFMLGTLQTWTRNAALCRMMLLSHLFGACFAGAAVYLTDGGERAAPPARKPSIAGENPLAQSIDAILQVGGCIICYSVLASLLRLLPHAQGLFGALMHGVLEVSGGMHAICRLTLPESLRAVLLAALSGFSGCSILTQNLAVLRPLGVDMRRLMGFALLRAFGAGCCMAALRALFPM